MGIHVLGPVEVDAGELLRPRDRTVLGALAVRRDHVVTPEEVADAVWGDAPPASWRKQVQICVARLRKVLGAGTVETSPDGGYRLVTARVDLDVETFEGLVARGRELAAVGETARAATSIGRALALVRSVPFVGLDAWPPARTESARLLEVVRSAEDDLLELRLALGEHRAVMGWAESLVLEDPLRERRWAAVALARYRCGRQGDALRTLRDLRSMLRDELGIDPGAEIVELEQQILRQDDALRHVPVPGSVASGCPYKGLAPLEPGDPIFGREDELASCLERLSRSSSLVVVGASGSGKSSLVRAGLLPELARRVPAGAVLVTDPGTGVDVPPGSGPGPALVVDQLEQLFLRGRPASEVRSTCEALVAYAAHRGSVVFVVRSDRLGHLAADQVLSRLVEENLFLLGPLSGDRLREAVVQPAVDAGLHLEPGLVDLVVRDAEGAAGALPLLSHALAETWRRRDGSVLTVEGYRASGGIAGAVARSADQLYESLPASERAVFRSVLLRLVTPAPEGDPLRHRVPVRTFREDAAREPLVGRLVDARLVTVVDDGVEISHEALVRAWPRLRAWLDEDAAGARVRRHLAVTAEGWESLGRPRAELYRGARLQAAEEQRRAGPRDLTRTERDFLDASLELEETERETLRRKARRDATRARRLRAALAAVIVLLLAAGTAGVVAADRARDARVARDEARIEALANRSLALRDTDRAAAALLAVEASRRWPGDARARSALLGTFTAEPGFLGNRYVEGATSLRGAVVPGTRHAVVAADGTRPALVDLESGETLVELEVPGPEPAFGRGVVVSADGRRAALLLAGARGSCPEGVDDDVAPCGTFVVVDLATGRALTGQVPVPDGRGALALDADGSVVALVGAGSGALQLRDVATGDVVGEVPGLGGPDVLDDWAAGAVAFGPDGALFVGSRAGPVRRVDPASAEVVQTIALPPSHSDVGLHVGADGVLVAAGRHGIAAVDTRSGRESWRVDLRGSGPDPCPWFAVDEVRGRIYCGSHFGEIEERDLANGQRTGVVLDTQLGSVGDLALTDRGDELVTFGAQAPVIGRWRLDGSGPVAARVADGYVAADRFGYDEDGTLLVARRDPRANVAADLRDVALWDTRRDVLVDDVAPDLEPGLEGVGWAGRALLVGMRPDVERMGWYDTATRSLVPGPEIGPECDHLWATAEGERAYCGGTDGRVWTIDVPGRGIVEPTIQVDGEVRSVSATTGGHRVVVTAATPTASVTTVHDGTTGELLAGPVAGPELTAVSPDGTLVGALHGGLTLYSIDDLEPVGELAGARGEVNTLQFSDDGRVLLATSNDQSASVYDVATRLRLGDPIGTAAPLIYPAFLRPDGDALAVTDRHGVVVWDLRLARLRDAACAVAGRNLTRTEWASYLRELGDRRATCPGLPVP